MAFKLMPGNVDDHTLVPDLTQDLFCKLFGDRDYFSQPLFELLFDPGLQLITKQKKNMNHKLVKLMDKILLSQRALIEAVNEQIKNICQIENSRHGSVRNLMVNLLASLFAYTYLSKNPSLDLEHIGLLAFPPASFIISIELTFKGYLNLSATLISFIG